MKVRGLDHITINVRDLTRSVQFYHAVLGLEESETVDLGDHVLHYFPLFGQCRLELIEYLGEQKFFVTGGTDLGIYRHFAVVVDDLEEIRSICEQLGYPVRLNPLYLKALGKKIMLIEDPNGVEIELIEKAGEN